MQDFNHNPHRPLRSYGHVGGVSLRPREYARHRNILDIEDIDVPLHRVFSLKRFRDILETRSMTLTRTPRWEDPFENFLLRATGRMPNGEEVSLRGLHDNYYGQCWTLREESDAMWRIYSPKEMGVKLKTTARKLFDAVYDHEDRFSDLTYFLGLVQYLPEAQLVKIMSNPDITRALLFDGTGVNQVRTLLWKREEFSHEEEVRLIFCGDRKRHDLDTDFYPFAIDPNGLFDEVVIDPRADESQVQEITEEICRRGYTGPLRQSPLYRLPDFEIPLGTTSPPRPMGARAWRSLDSE